ncbi:hypothetical protein CASFOL_012781 [Castilleja foliolosa]|uniref:Uncharacterized protein n=1 Tax=Castilleja foliolosa TaxID=1961234 RepID=A0ABD3DM45_9LAMI
MQAIGAITKSRRLTKVLKVAPPSFINDSVIENACVPSNTPSPRRRFHFATGLSGHTHRSSSRIELNYQKDVQSIMGMPHRLFSSEAKATENDSADAETVKGVYEKMLNYVAEKRTAPPNALLWSLISKCSTHEDIELLFDVLQKHRTFRLSNLRIPEGFNSALCRAVTKACVRAGAIDFWQLRFVLSQDSVSLVVSFQYNNLMNFLLLGSVEERDCESKKTLWKNNLFGLTPDIGSAHQLLLYAKQHKDVKLMTKIMKLVKINFLPLQPGTADIVFSICYNEDRWDLMSKNGKRFVKSGVKLRPTSFELWMEFAARKGDVESLWKIEKWRSEAMKHHSLSTGVSCAKGFLLEHKPDSAAAIIQVLDQTLSDARRSSIAAELQKLVSEWPLDVIKHQKEENKQAFAETLQEDISTMINALSTLGVDANVSI